MRFSSALSAVTFLTVFPGLIAASITNSHGAEDATDADAIGTDAPTSSPLEGHSGHGEVFNEGPRQAAYLMDGVGHVRFDVTTDNPEARQFLVQGVAQLHGFWYFESERSFRQAASIDPDCAMAYWGMAMSNRSNAERAQGFITEAMSRRNHASRREQLYIEAFDRFINASAKDSEDKEKRARRYIKDLESLLLSFPDDIEAKAFLCEFLWSASRDGVKIHSYIAVDALLQDVLNAEPQHPCHHYRIHLWDRRDAKTALQAAAQCGPASPAIAHMWHMPGHIYSKLHRYADAVWQQEASARVDHAHMMKDRVLPDQIHNFAHNNEWCIRNLIHIGRVRDAVDLAKNMIELPRHPEFNHIGKSGSYKYGTKRLLQIMRTWRMHDELIHLAEQPWLQETGDARIELERERTLAVAYAANGRCDEAESIRSEVQSLLDDEKAEQAASGESARATATEKKKDESAIRKAVRTAERSHRTRLKELQDALDHIDGQLAAEAKEFDAAVELLGKAKGVPVEDVVANLFDAGRVDEAIEKIVQHVNTNQGEVRPLTAMVLTYWKAGKVDEAEVAFEKLRKLSASIDPDVPAVADLAPVARELGFDEDWRIVPEPASDLGVRPDLDSLGPFRWSPGAAPDWSLPGTENQIVSLSSYRGKPVVVIFYLGFGCLHCAEQLQKFEPQAEKFREAGIEVVAISSDQQGELSKAFDNYDGEFSFPIVADPELNTFRAYRCYDDFEQQALHGTFVVDSDGLIRWQDISYQPFMDPEFVLKEAQRLVSIPAAGPAEVPGTEIGQRSPPAESLISSD